ncbi:hypothetical protein RhiJN_16072 [Ceratobasidium sp. AG-Ba]|nr:hypothetical protein RhiJN_16072 [Ceratobasidium sp. AG-Ba]
MIHEIVNFVSEYKGLLTEVVKNFAKNPDEEHLGLFAWPFSPRERFEPMCNFAASVLAAQNFESEELKIEKMQEACQALRLFIQENRELFKALRKVDDKLKSYTKKLRARVLYLVAQQRITLEALIEKLTVEQLQDLVDKNPVPHDFDVFMLDDYHNNHNCNTCRKSTSEEYGKYRSPLDGNGTPQIPGLFPKGPVSLEDVENHNFRYITGGTTCGLSRSPENGEKELALFVWYPDINNETPEQSARLE